jgi:hypothetical protein
MYYHAFIQCLYVCAPSSPSLLPLQIGNPVAILIGGLRDLAARQRLTVDEARETDAADAAGREERVTLTLYPSGDNNVFAMVLAIDSRRLVADAHVDFMHADAMLSDAAIDAEIGADVSRILSIASATPSAPELRAAFDALEAKIRSVRQLECLLTEFPNGTGDGELALHAVDARIAEMFHAAAAASGNSHSDARGDADMTNASGANVSASAHTAGDGNGSAAAEFDVRPLCAATRRCFQGPQLDLFTRPRLPFVEAGQRSTADRGVTRLTYVGLERELPPPAIASSSVAHRTDSNTDAMDCAAPTFVPSASSASPARPPAFDILLRVDPPLALPSRVLSALGLLPPPRAAVPPPAAAPSTIRAAGGKTDALDAEFALVWC